MIDKGLYAAPTGLEQAAQDMPELEIEIEDPEAVRIGVDGQPILEIEKDESDDEFSKNLAEDMYDSELSEIASDLVELFDSDVNARRDWVETYSEGLKLLGLKVEERTEPWEGACGVFHPMLTESVVRFQSESIMETFPAQGPVKTQLIGKETKAAIFCNSSVIYNKDYRQVIGIDTVHRYGNDMFYRVPLELCTFRTPDIFFKKDYENIWNEIKK